MLEKLKRSKTWTAIFERLGEKLKAEDVESILWMRSDVPDGRHGRQSRWKSVGLFKMKNDSFVCVRFWSVETDESGRTMISETAVTRADDEKSADWLLTETEKADKVRGIFVDSKPLAAAR